VYEFFAVFDEVSILNNPDVAFSVAAGAFSSGLDHFQRFGLQEGRTLVSPSTTKGFICESTLMWLHLLRGFQLWAATLQELVLRVMLPQCQIGSQV